MGRRSASGPASEAGLACPRTRPCSCPHACVLTAADARRRVVAMRRRRRHLAVLVAPAPHALAYTSARVTDSPALSPIFLSHASSRARARARLRHCPHQCLTGVSRFGRSSSLELAPSRPKLRLHLTHPVLASVSHGKLPFLGNPSSE